MFTFFHKFISYLPQYGFDFVKSVKMILLSFVKGLPSTRIPVQSYNFSSRTTCPFLQPVQSYNLSSLTTCPVLQFIFNTSPVLQSSPTTCPVLQLVQSYNLYLAPVQSYNLSSRTTCPVVQPVQSYNLSSPTIYI